MRPCSWVLVRGERELCATREAEGVASTAGVRVPLRCPFGNGGRVVCLQRVRVREPRARATAVRRAIYDDAEGRKAEHNVAVDLFLFLASGQALSLIHI